MNAPIRMLRRREVQSLTGLCCSQLYDFMAGGLFPRPVRIGRKAVAWLETEVAAWQASRIAERDGKAGLAKHQWRDAKSQPEPETTP